MITHRLLTVRPNVTTPFYVVSEKFHNFREENFIATGKIISRIEDLDASELVNTVTTIFKDMDSFMQFISDPITLEMIKARTGYNAVNGLKNRGEVQTI